MKCAIIICLLIIAIYLIHSYNIRLMINKMINYCGCCNTSRENCECMANCMCACKEGYINNTRTVTLYYTNWCPKCALMKPVWNQVKTAMAGSNIVFKEHDEDTGQTQGIMFVPTICMVDENGHLSTYIGTADFNTLHNWVAGIEIGFGR